MRTLTDQLQQKGPLAENEALRLADVLSKCFSHAEVQGEGRVPVLTTELISLADDGTLDVARVRLSNEPSDCPPCYRSPELVQGRRQDSRSLMYSMGAFLYHALTGAAPFGAWPEEDIPACHLREDLPDPRRLGVEVSEATVRLLQHLLARHAEDRPRDWIVFSRLLADARAGRESALPLLPGDDSSLRVSPPREKPTGHAPARHGASRRVVMEASAAEKRRVAMSTGLNQQIERARHRKRRAHHAQSPALIYFLLLAIGIALGIQLGWFETLRERYFRAQTPTDFDGERSYTRVVFSSDSENGMAPVADEPERPAAAEVATVVPVTPPPVVPSHRPTPPTGAAAPPPSHRQPTPQPKVRWNDPDFLTAAASFNRAVDAYQTFVRDKDQRHLDVAEQNARDAAEVFQRIKPRAPAGIPIDTYIRQSYQLVSDCRWNRMMK